jgi:PKD repeat protein
MRKKFLKLAFFSGRLAASLFGKLSPMKMIRNLILMLVLLPAFRLSAQCTADYTWSVSGNQVSFSSVLNSPPNIDIYWVFGDSGFDMSNNPAPTHTYSGPGTYNACIFISDSATCADSSCHNIVISTGGCNADFTWVDSSGYVFFISSSTLGNGGNYFWDFGDGNYSNQQYPSNNYASPGVYLVCLMVTDSMQNFCDSTSHYVTATSVASGVNENATAITNLSLSPNPADATATFSFQMPAAGNVNISVHDIYGREISNQATQFSPGKQQAVINTENFAAGTYIVKISTSGQSVQSRLIITH